MPAVLGAGDRSGTRFEILLQRKRRGHMGQMWEISVTVEAADGSEGFVLVTQLCILD